MNSKLTLILDELNSALNNRAQNNKIVLQERKFPVWLHSSADVKGVYIRERANPRGGVFPHADVQCLGYTTGLLILTGVDYLE